MIDEVVAAVTVAQLDRELDVVVHVDHIRGELLLNVLDPGHEDVEGCRIVDVLIRNCPHSPLGH